MSEETNEIKENFCSSCIGATFALAGVGTTVAGSMTSYKTLGNVLIWGGFGVIVLSFVVLLVGVLMK